MENSRCPLKSLKYTVVVPVFNEAENIETLYSRLTTTMIGLKDQYEIIFVDDGSSDGSLAILKRLYEHEKCIRIIQFTRNFGQHPAVMAGLEAARGEIVITIDADLQNPPEEIPTLLERLNDGCEVVFGVFKNRKHSAFRRLGSTFTKKVLSMILPVGMTNLSAFRAMNHYVVDNLKEFTERSKFLDGLICWMGYTVGSVEVNHSKRLSGKTKYNVFKLVALWIDMLVCLTDVPLKIATYFGSLLGMTSILMALYYLIRYLVSGFSVPGFATTVILITVLAGIQLFCLGVLGEYIGRMNTEVKKKPEYIVRETYD